MQNQPQHPSIPNGLTPKLYVGRFAPSPTGPLHFGSLLGALASFLDARANGGQWLVRIEDIDPPREVAGAAQAILDCLVAHGLSWDGEVMYQSARTSIYRDICTQLLDNGRAFFCTCSRADLIDQQGIYSGRCRACSQQPAAPYAIRLTVEDMAVGFEDAVLGHIEQSLAHEVGDFVIFRKEKLPAYQLAVVIDDAAQGVTHIVRGSDLLDSTPRQIFLQRCLQYPQPFYAHIPVIANAAGQKLSKQTYAAALAHEDAAENLLAALSFLRQPLPIARVGKTPHAILEWAIAQWDITRIPRQRLLSGEQLPAPCRHFAS
ncbi:MAG: tRNA glutamyl-Q(34) synthetase GluQRS [Verrucomicrobiaceae bacterium]|nr:tRNA glutamyl-Q(34) synthetase GluQRS [Verrucomicrobiaceae bacterium]